jgi:hypothetical protein
MFAVQDHYSLLFLSLGVECRHLGFEELTVKITRDSSLHFNVLLKTFLMGSRTPLLAALAALP